MSNTRFSKEQIENFKTDINLVHFAIHRLGYVYKIGYQNKLASNTTIVLNSPDNTETLLFRVNPKSNHYMYLNPENADDHGTIIDFCINKINLNYLDSLKLLNESLGNINVDPSLNIKLIPSQSVTQKFIDKNHFKFNILSDLNYLKSRHLTENVINHPIFHQTIGNKEIRTESKTEAGKFNTFNNTAFKIIDKNKHTIGLSLRNKAFNKNFKGNLIHSNTKGMWMSNITTKPTKLTFAFAESPIDAMSHFQMFHNTFERDPQIVYFSSNGQLRDEHIDFVQHFIDIHKPERALLINDNDNAGIRFNINYLGKLRNPTKTHMKVKYFDNHEIEIACKFISPNNRLELKVLNFQKQNRKPQQMVDHLKAFIKKFNNNMYQQFSYKKEELKTLEIVASDALIEAKFQFDNRLELLKEVMKFSTELKPSKMIKVQLPKSKDFNEDLKKTYIDKQQNNSLLL